MKVPEDMVFAKLTTRKEAKAFLKALKQSKKITKRMSKKVRRDAE